VVTTSGPSLHSIRPLAIRLPAEARREQIIDVAVGVFARNGYHGTSMNQVAEAAGVTKPVLYQHFDSKQDLYGALIDVVGERMLNAISQATSDATTGKGQTELGFRAYFRWVAEDRDAFLLLYGLGANRDDDSIVAVRRITAAAAVAIEPLIAADIEETHRRTLAHGLVGLAEGVSRHLLESSLAFNPDVLGGQVAALAWAGLRAVHRE
jgi:AcrR family transcriptional regulator